MPIETLDDVIEWLADLAGIYGCGEDNDHETDCSCRICFEINARDRILAAVEIERKLGRFEKRR